MAARRNRAALLKGEHRVPHALDAVRAAGAPQLLGWALAAAVLTVAPALAKPSAWMLDRISGTDAFHGRYTNVRYGFSVMPPAGAAAYVAGEPELDRGLLIILGERRTIHVSAEHDLASDMRPCAGKFPADRLGARLHSMGMLGGRSACAVTLAEADSFEQVLEQPGADRGVGILYTLRLCTTPQAKASDLAAFRSVAASFARVPITP